MVPLVKNICSKCLLRIIIKSSSVLFLIYTDSQLPNPDSTTCSVVREIYFVGIVAVSRHSWAWHGQSSRIAAAASVVLAGPVRDHDRPYNHARHRRRTDAALAAAVASFPARQSFRSAVWDPNGDKILLPVMSVCSSLSVSIIHWVTVIPWIWIRRFGLNWGG